MREIPFIKMDGLGNDFMIIDERQSNYHLDSSDIFHLSNRKTGVGFDQMMILRKSDDSKFVAKMLIFNADGTEAGACGNGTRCVGKLLLDETQENQLLIEGPAGRILGVNKEGSQITVNLGKPKLGWEDIPLSRSMDTLTLPALIEELSNPVAVNVGNPHVIFFVDDVESINLATYGEKIETHNLFPKRTNVEFAEIIDENNIRMRVWERGAGITMACGSGACATLVAAVRKNLSARKVNIVMDGGTLTVEWTWQGDILLTGDTHLSFKGTSFI